MHRSVPRNHWRKADVAASKFQGLHARREVHPEAQADSFFGESKAVLTGFVRPMPFHFFTSNRNSAIAQVDMWLTWLER